jgi:hypothetical protein
MCPNGNRRMRDNSHFNNAIGLYENHSISGLSNSYTGDILVPRESI